MFIIHNRLTIQIIFLHDVLTSMSSVMCYVHQVLMLNKVLSIPFNWTWLWKFEFLARIFCT